MDPRFHNVPLPSLESLNLDSIVNTTDFIHCLGSNFKPILLRPTLPTECCLYRHLIRHNQTLANQIELLQKSHEQLLAQRNAITDLITKQSDQLGLLKQAFACNYQQINLKLEE